MCFFLLLVLLHAVESLLHRFHFTFSLFLFVFFLFSDKLSAMRIPKIQKRRLTVSSDQTGESGMVWILNKYINKHLIDVTYKKPFTNQLYCSVCFLPVPFYFTLLLCYLQRFIYLTLTTDQCEKSLLVRHYKGAFSCYPQKHIMKEFSQSKQNILFFSICASKLMEILCNYII